MFRDRLKQAAKHAGVEFSQTAIAKSLGLKNKQTVDRWMGDGMPSPEMIYRIADAWRVDPRWLATDEGDMLPSSRTAHQPTAVYSVAGAAELVEHFEKAPAPWRAILLLLTKLRAEDQARISDSLAVLLDQSARSRRPLFSSRAERGQVHKKRAKG